MFRKTADPTETKLASKHSSFALAPSVRKKYGEVERNLIAGDYQILQIKEMKNNLESYSYEMRSNLDSYGTLEKYVDPDTK